MRVATTPLSASRAATGLAYAVLGATLVWSRLVGLDRGLSSDEITTVKVFLARGAWEILAGFYIPNNHKLYSLLAWATSSLGWDSDVAIRLWSVIPFIAGVAIVTAWLHVRVGAFSGILCLFFSTASPLLVDITRQARGYGLAFLAMSVLVVAALEAVRSRRTAWVVVFCVAGVAGTWTLPNFGVAFLATGVVLLAQRDLRRATTVALAISGLASLVWYAPHLDDILQSSRQDYALPIQTAWLITAPFDQILLPALAGIDELLVDPRPGTLVLSVILAIVVASSPFLRDRLLASVLCAGIVTSIGVFWVTQTKVAPRFLSFLLVPFFVLLATGAASILSRMPFDAGVLRRRSLVQITAVLITLAFAGLQFAQHMPGIARLPRESSRDAAEIIRSLAPADTPVIAYVPYPRDLEWYLGRQVSNPRTPAEALAVCDEQRAVVFLFQPWVLEPVDVPCTRRNGVRHVRLEQYARGGSVDVWLLPARNG